MTAVQEFCKRYQLPGVFEVFDWHRATREFFAPNNGKPNCMETPFVHADESETSLGLLMFPEMIKMDYACLLYTSFSAFTGKGLMLYCSPSQV